MGAASTSVRIAALGGVVGPAAFVSAWAVGAAITNRDYSSIDNPISRLAAMGADSRPLMPAGFVVFGLGLPAYAVALRRVINSTAWLSAAATGIATLAVAAAPLDHSAAVDTWHGVFATAGYVTLAATPLLAARPLWRQGQRTLAATGVTAGVVSTISLALTVSSLPTGLFQRLGLTVVDAWVVASAVAMTRGRLKHTR
jgi:hypothetical membrane protein